MEKFFYDYSESFRDNLLESFESFGDVPVFATFCFTLVMIPLAIAVAPDCTT